MLSRLIAHHKLRNEARRRDSAVHGGEYSERPIDYIYNDVESIWGIERKMSDVEIESYKRFGQVHGFPEIGTTEKSRKELPFEKWLTREAGDDEDEIEYWGIFFEKMPTPKEGSYTGTTMALICNAGYTDSESNRQQWKADHEHTGPSFSAIFQGGQDTGMRSFVRRGSYASSARVEDFAIFRISDCMIFCEPPEYDINILDQPYEIKIQPFSTLARAFFHHDRWRFISNGEE